MNPESEAGHAEARNEASSAEPPDSRHNQSNTGSGASSSSRSGPTGDTFPRTLELVNSVFTGGDSEDSVYYFGRPSGRSTSTPTGFGPGSVSAETSAIIRGNSKRDKFVRSSDGQTSTLPTASFAEDSAQGSASAILLKDSPVHAKGSVFIGGKSTGSKFYIGMPGSSSSSSSFSMKNQQSLAEYRMDRNPRGLCVIINNVKFQGSKGDRLGSDIDAAKLAGLFQKLHFKVEVKENLTASAMLDWFKTVSQLSHSDYDCFACCILTHGALGQLCGANSETLEIQQILKLFTGNSCPSLNTKPKMFFIQACRGNAEQEGVESVELPETDDEPRGVGAGIPKTFPIEADFLLSYATVPGYVAYRGISEGSWYVSALVDQINKLHNTTDMLNILTAVNKTLCDRDARRKKGIKKQVGAPSYTLEKVLYLRSLE